MSSFSFSHDQEQNYVHSQFPIQGNKDGQKFESRLCIKTGTRISPCGRSTPRSVTGISANLRKEKCGNPWLQLQQENNPLLFTIFQFCFIRIFAASITEIRVVSHNLHSFNKSGTYCKLILNRHGGIWFGQEL